jgi:DNA polymerase
MWTGCRKCPLCETRKHVVLSRGTLPCRLLFIGEAPGPSENLIGKPFVGPAGKLLDIIVKRSCGDLPCAFTNLVACFPSGEDGRKIAEPDIVDIIACQNRLKEYVGLAKPSVIVTVGALAGKWISQDPGHKHQVKVDCPVINIKHPSAILHAPRAMQIIDIQRCIVQIQKGIEEHVTS